METELAFADAENPALVPEAGATPQGRAGAAWSFPVVPETEPPLDPLRQAWALAKSLERRGLAAEVAPARGDLREHPCVTVRSGPERHAIATEHVYAGPAGEDGAWGFLWHHLEPIAPLGDVDGAAAVIARLLSCSGAVGPSECPVCAEMKRKAE